MHLPFFVLKVLRPLRAIAALLFLAAVVQSTAAARADPAAGVNVMTDSSAYAIGDPIQVTVSNSGPDRITRGGLACDDIWPLAIEQQQADANWQPVSVSRHQCIGIAGVLVAPGQSQIRTINVPLDPGTYHVVYGFTIVGSGDQLVATSDPFDILDTPNPP